MNLSRVSSSFLFTSILVWAGLGVALGVSVATTMNQTGDLADYFRFEVLPGQFLFILVKFSGLTAMALMVVQLSLVLARSVLPIRLSTGQHRALGAVTLLIIAFHVTAFVVAVSMRNKMPTLDLLWPNFQGYYRTWLTAGLIGFWLLILGLIGTLLGGHWRRLHWLMPVGFMLAFLHSLMVGSEARAEIMPYLYAIYVLLILAALIVRMRSARVLDGPRLSSN